MLPFAIAKGVVTYGLGLIFYLRYEAPRKKNKNFRMVMEMLRAGD